MTTDDRFVLLERPEPGIALVTLNRAEVLNAINAALTLQLQQVRQEIEADPSIRVAILAGGGEQVFCAGADLKEVGLGRGPSGLSSVEGGFAGFVRAARSKPWIAAVRGKAIGGGFELVLACDLVVAGESAEFALPEARIGVLAAAGGAFRVARALPRPLANELLLTGKPLSSLKALAFGLVNQRVADDQVSNAAFALARDIIRSAPLSVEASLDLVNRAADLNEAELWQLNEQWVQRIVQSPDAREGPRAFLQKRAPQWSVVTHHEAER